MTTLTSRTALVTGGSRGIGRAVARRLARDGVLVGVHYGHDDAAAEETVQGIRAEGGQAFAFQAELGTPDDAETLWTRFRRGAADNGFPAWLDILVNNAGMTLPRTITDVTGADYDRLFAVNVRAPFFLLQQALPHLRDGGRVINITSAATRVATPGLVAYGMTKAALEALTLALAQQLGARGITVNSVSPGIVDTGINPTLAVPALRAAYSALSVFARIGTPEDIADVVAFLAGDNARWVTGQSIDASGGLHLGVPAPGDGPLARPDVPAAAPPVPTAASGAGRE